MMTDGAFSKAMIKSIGAERIHEHLDKGKIVIVAGFQGIDQNENVTTLGRGGSDTTAVALAAALEAEQCVIYTDVDGIYTTDPRIFTDAVKLDRISYVEMLEMASLGAGVMHIRAVGFGMRYNVNIHVRNSGNDKNGTIISAEESKMEGVSVTGATVQRDMAKIDLIKIDNTPGHAAKIFAHLARAKVVVNDIIQTELSPKKANLSFLIAAEDLDAAKAAIEEIRSKVNCEDVFVREDIAEVSVIGIGMRTHYGVAEKMFDALAEAKVNIDSITTSEIRISCAVDRNQAEKALRAVCVAFELDKQPNDRAKS